MRDAKMIHHAIDEMIDQRIDVPRSVIKRWHCWNDHRSGLSEPQHIFEMNSRERAFSRNYHKLAALFQTDISGAMEQVRHAPDASTPIVEAEHGIIAIASTG